MRGLGFLALVALGQEWQLYTVAAVGGLVWAGSSALTSAITADSFGVGAVGTLFGLLYLVHQFGAAAGTFLGGWLFAAFGSYAGAFGLAALLLFLGAALSLRLDNRTPLLRAVRLRP